MSTDDYADDKALAYVNEYLLHVPIDSKAMKALVLVIKQAMRDQRHACAEAAMQAVSPHSDILADLAHDAAMNVRNVLQVQP